MAMTINGGGFDPLRGAGANTGTPFIGQTSSPKPTDTSGAAGGRNLDDLSTLSPELGESEGGANALLAAWGAGPAAQPPALAVQGVNPGAQAGFSVSGGQVGGLEPGAQAGGVMLGPVLRA